MRRAAFCSWGLAAALASAVAHAQPAEHPRAEACFDAAEAAQPLLKQHKLREAQRQLMLCARDACPRAARTDCKTWLDQVTRTLPTVVFRARASGEHGDVAVDDVRVTIDGEVIVAEHLDDAPVPLDPGPHQLRFERAGAPPVEVHVDLREGEARRIVDVVFGKKRGAPSPAPPEAAPAPALPAGPPSVPAPEAAPGSGAAPDAVPALTWVLGGGGLLVAAIGGALEASGLSSRSGFYATCAPSRTCSPSSVDSARSQVAAGDVSLVLGAGLLGGALYVYLSRPRPEGTGLRLRVAPLVGGAAGVVEGRL